MIPNTYLTQFEALDKAARFAAEARRRSRVRKIRAAQRAEWRQMTR